MNAQPLPNDLEQARQSYRHSLETLDTLIADRNQLKSQLDAESQIISDLKRENSILVPFRLQSHKRTHQSLAEKLSKLERRIVRSKLRVRQHASALLDTIAAYAENDLGKAERNSLAAEYDSVSRWLKANGETRHRLAGDVRDVLNLKINPLDDSEEILEKADLVKDREEEVRKALKTVEHRIKTVKEERKIKRFSRTTRIGENIFDDSAYSAVVNRESHANEREAPRAAEQPAAETAPAAVTKPAPAEDGKAPITDPSESALADGGSGGPFAPAAAGQPDITVNNEPTGEPAGSLFGENIVNQGNNPVLENSAPQTELEGRLISPADVDAGLGLSNVDPDQIDDLGQLKKERARLKSLLRKLNRKHSTMLDRLEQVRSESGR